jgi:REP element-mobilizing transposase RayT
MTFGVFSQLTGYHNRRSIRLRNYDIAGIKLDAFVIMPNHVPGIIIIAGAGSGLLFSVGAGSEPAPTNNNPNPHALPEIIRQFKTFSAKRISESRNTPGAPIWQRNYYEHIIRDEKSLFLIRRYIRNNARNWNLDEENPSGKSPRYVAMLNPQR